MSFPSTADVEEFLRVYMRRVEESYREVVTEVLPRLLVLAPAQERLARYAALDWDALARSDPWLWSRLSADALRLAERERGA